MSLIAPDSRVYVAGHRGVVGSAIWRDLTGRGYDGLIGHRSSEVDLRDRDSTMDAIGVEDELELHRRPRAELR